jgi:hypothetical protein
VNKREEEIDEQTFNKDMDLLSHLYIYLISYVQPYILLSYL